MRGSSLRQRLALAGVIAVFCALALAAWGLTLLFTAHVERRTVSELETQLIQLIAGIGQDASGALRVASPPADPRFAQPFSGLYWQLEMPQGAVYSRSLWDQSLALSAQVPAEGVQVITHLPGPNNAMLIAVERAVVLPPSLGGAVISAMVAADRQSIAQASEDFARDMLPYLGLLGAVFFAAGWIQLRVGLRPLGELAKRLAAVQAGRAQRIGERLPAEVQPLAADFDALIKAREAELEAARKRAGDLAHGLKTPLQAMLSESKRLHARGELESATALESIFSAMQRHVERELTRARAAIRGAQARSNPRLVVEQVVNVVQKTPDGEALEWVIDSTPDSVQPAAAIDAADLAEALGALIENAARYANSRVHVTISAEPGEDIEIAIEDDGPGIPAEALKRLMARGARLDESGPGSGLGLAICQEIVDGIGGRLTLETVDTGFVARLSVPQGRADMLGSG